MSVLFLVAVLMWVAFIIIIKHLKFLQKQKQIQKQNNNKKTKPKLACSVFLFGDGCSVGDGHVCVVP